MKIFYDSTNFSKDTIITIINDGGYQDNIKIKNNPIEVLI